MRGEGTVEEKEVELIDVLIDMKLTFDLKSGESLYRKNNTALS